MSSNRLELVTCIKAFVLSLGLAGFAHAQSSSIPVVVVDIGYIFKNHTRYIQAMDRIKEQVKVEEQKFKKRTEDLEQTAKSLANFKPSSDEYRAREAEIAGENAQIQADVTIMRKELLEKESQLFFAIYNEIQSEIKTFADNQGIGLVLRFSSDPVDPLDRNSVLQGVNRPVVYQRNLNITYEILNRLKRTETARAGSNKTSQPTSTK